jgi:hypothetical protein
MKTFFNSFNQSIELQDLDSFLLKMGANLATAQPHELFALFKQLESKSKFIIYSLFKKTQVCFLNHSFKMSS